MHGRGRRVMHLASLQKIFFILFILVLGTSNFLESARLTWNFREMGSYPQTPLLNTTWSDWKPKTQNKLHKFVVQFWLIKVFLYGCFGWRSYKVIDRLEYNLPIFLLFRWLDTFLGLLITIQSSRHNRVSTVSRHLHMMTTCAHMQLVQMCA
jgi:hypothetical protein